MTHPQSNIAPHFDAGGRPRMALVPRAPDAGAGSDEDEPAEDADRASKLGSLTRLVTTLHATSDPVELAETFAREARVLLGADLVAVVGFEPETGEGVPIAEEPAPVGRAWFDVTWPSAQAASSFPPAAHFAGEVIPGSEWLAQLLTRRGLSRGVAVRLDADDEVVGLVVAGVREGCDCGPMEARLLVEIATPLAMLLERARLVASLRQQADRTHAILDLVAALGPRETMEDVARPVAAALRTMFAADACLVALADGRELRVVGHDGAAALPHAEAHFPLSALEPARRSFRAGARIVANLDRVRNPFSPLARALRSEGMHSAAEVLFRASPATEVLVTLASAQPRRFVDAQGRQLAQILRPLGVAAAYYEGRHEAEVRARRLENTNRLLGDLTTGGPPRALASAVLPTARELFSASLGFIVWLDPTGERLDVLAVDDIAPGDPVPTHVPSDLPGLRELLLSRSPHRVRDARSEDANAPPFRGRLYERGLHSVLRAPLTVRGETRGAIVLWGPGVEHFTREDLALLRALAGPLAIALDNALAAEALAESELKYRSLVSQAEEMIFLVDADTLRILETNPYALRALGYAPADLPELTLERFVDDAVEAIQANVARVSASRQLRIGDRRYRRKDGSVIDVDVVASLVAYAGREAILVLARDISERLALQRQLHQSQKMESLGTMAGNVAHDFNNLLTAVLGFAGILKLSRQLSAEDRETLALMESAGQRAADLSGRLLSFARGGLVSFGPVDLRRVVTDTLSLAEPLLHAAHEVRTDLPRLPVLVEGDAGQLQQAVFNIILNARDACAEGGHITVALEADGRHATLQVRDDGCGMDDETRLRIFEPFFTTKPPGSGTGLGMSITYGIVQAHHGEIAVVSAPGAGTTFTLRFPAGG